MTAPWCSPRAAPAREAGRRGQRAPTPCVPLNLYRTGVLRRSPPGATRRAPHRSQQGERQTGAARASFAESCKVAPAGFPADDRPAWNEGRRSFPAQSQRLDVSAGGNSKSHAPLMGQNASPGTGRNFEDARSLNYA